MTYFKPAYITCFSNFDARHQLEHWRQPTTLQMHFFTNSNHFSTLRWFMVHFSSLHPVCFVPGVGQAQGHGQHGGAAAGVP